MARPANGPRVGPKSKTQDSAYTWANTRQLWDRASRAEIDLERAGKKVDFQSIWKAIRKYAPEDWPKDEEIPPLALREALDHPGYRQLLDIRKRMLVIPALKDLGLLKDVAGQAAYVALMSAYEDLLIRPEGVPVSEKRQLARTFMEMNLRLGGIKAEDEEKHEENSLEDIAAAEQAERERVLSGIPEQYRELMGQRWDEERLRNLRTRQAIHIVQGNEKMGHAKSN